jgi:glycosyltransferase involved in cell wall biosynthesis
MKIALISTVYNEGEDVFAWAESLRAQTRQPDEFVIVDGGSTDGTPERLKQAFSHGDFPTPRIIVERCNIARGRNLAIQNTTAEIIASTDAGSYPEPAWLDELTKPLLNDPAIDVVGGNTRLMATNDFQRLAISLEAPPSSEEGFYPSSRNIALRRAAWASVGGYPEWLTLAGEDALYNYELHAAGNRVACNPCAIVRWPYRPTPEAFYKLYYRNGYGAAEAKLFRQYFFRRLLITIFPPLLLLSRRRSKHFKHRYRTNAASALGWLAGKIKGRRPPPGWKRVDGILLSPETQSRLAAKK